jgi:hypothetical protein
MYVTISNDYSVRQNLKTIFHIGIMQLSRCEWLTYD